MEQNEKGLITVIVPVYKCEKHIRSCINSVLEQTVNYWNLILIDDGTPDKAGVISDEYAAMDERIRVIHLKNGGPGRARNYGIDACVTRWFTFLDSDDKLEKDYLQNFHVEELVDNTILSVQGFKRVDLEGNELGEKVDFIPQVYEGNQFLEKAFVESNLFDYGQSCGKLYNKELCDKFDLRMPTDIRHSEDHLFYLQYLMHITSYRTYGGCKYCYQLDESEVSITHKLIPYNEAVIRFHKLEKVCTDLVKTYSINSNVIHNQIDYFCVTGAISLVLRSLYCYEKDKRKRYSVLKEICSDLKRLNARYCPNSVLGKILRYIMLYVPVGFCDRLLRKFMK